MKQGAHLVSIDPGFNGTGYVYWDNQHTPFLANVVTPPRSKGSFIDSDLDIGRAHWIAEAVFDYQHSPIRNVLIELPEFQRGASRQMGWQTGDLQKLTMLVGVLAEFAIVKEGARVMFATPSEWKGQLPKEVVQHRLTKYFGRVLTGQLGVRAHAWDALGIGAWAYTARKELR